MEVMEWNFNDYKCAEGLILLITTCLFTLMASTAAQPSVTLPGTSTVISGEQKTVSGKLLDIYLSIPYAQPPTGERRFKDPEPITNLSPQINATQFPPSCLQRNFTAKYHANKNMSEDCLYLNIWTPSQRSNMSVLIFIYGGAFEYGSTDELMNNPQYLAARTDMVIVTMNYRVGSFGFLNLDMEESDGNLGFKDQILSFKWVKKNIRAFRGNPNSVTLYGLSAGSMSIAFHLSIEENKYLFNRAFLQSGTSNSAYFISKFKNQQAIDRYYEVLNFTEMEDQRICIKFCVKNGFKGAEIFWMLQTAYVDAVMSRKRVFEWYKRFKEGWEETADNEPSGRPSTSTTPEKVDKVLELASEWRFKNEPRPKKARKAPSKVKVMLTVFFDYQGIVHHEFQQQGSSITADSYLGVLRRLREAIRQKRPELWRCKSWILHHDNAPAHTALKI
ncbi:BCHE [Cordylochernes scorpioides]|uniref:Carboxylic ester hydrolase n=1 Tax=Cordylochernes scorpioides TaxID=51811 RepID=A0ABY6LD49_9ARAC|nr:BCHE [Cordylochernes scorpioides]